MFARLRAGLVVCIVLSIAQFASAALRNQILRIRSFGSRDNSKWCAGEIEIYDAYEMVSTSKFKSCVAMNTAEGYDCRDLFQGNKDSNIQWCSDPTTAYLNPPKLDGGSGWLTIIFTEKVKVTEIRIISKEGKYAPETFEIDVGNGGGVWEKAKTIEYKSWGDRQEKRWTGISLGGAVKWKNCYEILRNGMTKDGIYPIRVAGVNMNVYCDMANGGWTRVGVIPGTTKNEDFMTAEYVGPSVALQEPDADTFFMFSDLQIRISSNGENVFRVMCGTDTRYVHQANTWTSEIGADGWSIDRDGDGKPDCSASLKDYMFNDKAISGGTSGQTLHEGADCNEKDHFAFGHKGELGCSVAGTWGKKAAIWLRGAESADIIESCMDLPADRLTGVYPTPTSVVYCEQTLDNGGWTMIMKMPANKGLQDDSSKPSPFDNSFAYSSELWSKQSTTLNGDSLYNYPVNFITESAKMWTFNSMEFNEYLAVFTNPLETDKKKRTTTWKIGHFPSQTPFSFFSTARTVSTGAATVDPNFFSAKPGKTEGKLVVASDKIRFGYKWSNDKVSGLGLGTDDIYFSAGDQALNKAYSVTLYGRGYAGKTYEWCHRVPKDPKKDQRCILFKRCKQHVV